MATAEDTITYCQFSRELKKKLSDIIDADFGLLENLCDVLDERQFDSLHRLGGYDRTDKLMEILDIVPEDKFFNALRETGQQHVINFIFKAQSTGAIDTDSDLPLTESQRKIIKSNMSQLTQLIELDSLLPEIYASGCITKEHYDHVTVDGLTPRQRNTRLLLILLKRSQAAFDKFVFAFRKSFQGPVADILTTEAGVAAVRAESSDDVERKLVAMCQQYRERATDAELQRLLADWKELGPDATLLVVKKGHSIVIYIRCETLDAVHRLDSMLDNGNLKSMLERIFSTLIAGRDVDVAGLKFNVDSYNSCVHFFHKAMGCYDKFTILDPHNVVEETTEWQHSIPTEDLPLELLEMMLMKATNLVFKQLINLTSEAAVLAVNTVEMVCQQWWFTLSKREFNREQIKRMFDYGSKSHREVSGIATLDDQLFVVTQFSSTLSVFDLTSFGQQHVEHEGLEDPNDMATCNVTRRVYIADYSNRCVWLINWPPPFIAAAATTDPQIITRALANKFVDCGDEYAPWALSACETRQQLLVTDGCNCFHTYDFNGERVRRVDLSAIVPELDHTDVKWETEHAVQSTYDCYVLCRLGDHCGRPYTHAEIAEYDTDGKRRRCFYSGPRGYGPHQLGWPRYIAPFGDGRFIIVDRDTDRLLVLNTDLEMERVLIVKHQLNGARMCYNSATRLLLVGVWSPPEGRVNAYRIH